MPQGAVRASASPLVTPGMTSSPPDDQQRSRDARCQGGEVNLVGEVAGGFRSLRTTGHHVPYWWEQLDMGVTCRQ